MKWWAYVWSLHLLMLVLLPCREQPLRLRAEAGVQVEASLPHEQAHDDALCSPLCSCACCAHAVQAAFGVVALPPHPAVNASFRSRDVSGQSTHTAHFWHPPQ
ncbi:DUF6660 family protein [Catalinimonas alkaloidigena]|uniref:DUF6660 family protein n=1 Tax=Catalinimonas alkaloidigena TaxID=1075417 RepID=UPI0039779D98